jgi:FtsP/CotA-like multicopper oxidase with cupredoxin domain
MLIPGSRRGAVEEYGRTATGHVMEGAMREPAAVSDVFPTATTGLPAAQSPQSLDLGDGAEFDLRIAPVTKQLGGKPVRLLAYNGSIPGPTLRVRQGTELSVNVVNDGDLETTVHWHGLRLDNRYDGTTATQPPMPVGGAFTYRLTFPDPGVYWYHPHIREDYGQEMGLYGTIVVEPAEADYWPPVNRELTLTLDDILVEEGAVAPFNRRQPTYTAMGRFGNTLLANGEPELSMQARRNEVVRFYVANTANTRVFNVAIRGGRMKLVGGDSGRYEHEQFVDSVLIAPSERAVVDVLFEQAGPATLEHRTPNRTYTLATITVDEQPAEPSLISEYERLRSNGDLQLARAGMTSYLAMAPEKTLALVAEMDMGDPERSPGATVAYICPMHTDIVAEAPGRCPHCGMKLIATEQAPQFVCPMHPDVTSARPERCPKCGMKLVSAQLVAAASHGHHDHGHSPDGDRPEHDRVAPADYPAGIEWEDDMVDVNRMTNPSNMRWKLIDRQTGSEGASIDWRFRVGDRVKIRVVNEMDSDHPMHHPFHVHGAGRFLILARDGAVESNLVWKDTVVVPTGQTVDLLLEVTHPGVWMAHCHIAEHHESGMMLMFRVDRQRSRD